MTMRCRYKVIHTTTYAYGETVPVCNNQVCLTPRDGPHQSCLYHRLRISPTPSASSRRTDYFGNQVEYFSIDEGHQRLSLTAVSRVEVRPREPTNPAESTPWESVRETLRRDLGPWGIDAIQYTFDPPELERFGELAEYAAASFPPGRPVLEAVLDLSSRIHRDFCYVPQTTTVHTPLAEVFRMRRGVCQDFAHVQLACLRAMGLAARYVSGYLRTVPAPGQARMVGADASHAWVGVYCGRLGWVDVDPTNDLLVGADHITLAWGRCYTDVCPIKGVVIGGGLHSMSVAVDVVPMDGRA